MIDDKLEKINCKFCKLEYVFPRYKKRKYCSASCRSKDGNFGAGELHDNWKGDKVGYWGVHKWRQRNLPKTGICQHCHRSGLSNWSIHWANISYTYKRDNSDWMELCQSCHRLFDNGKLVIHYATS